MIKLLIVATNGRGVSLKTVLVTGACGYIGHHVVSQLSANGNQVIALDCRAGKFDSDAVKVVVADLLAPSFNLDDVLDEQVDVCLHLAWRKGFEHGNDAHMLDLSAHYRFLDQAIAAGIPQIAAMGSMHEVGYWEGAITEDTPCAPSSLYGIAKNALRSAFLLKAKQAGIRAQWFRGFYVYGDDEGSQSIFGKLYRAAEAGQKTFPFTTGTNLYDFIPVNELARQISAAVAQEEVLGIINCCTGNPRSLADQVEGFIKDRGLDIKLEYGAFPDRPYDSPGVWGDAEKINRIMLNASAGGE